MKFRRRHIITWLISVLLISVVVHAQMTERTYRVGLLYSPASSYWRSAQPTFNINPLQYALSAYGYERGKNLDFVVKWGVTEVELSERIAELIRFDLDVIVAGDLSIATALKRAAQTTPIVMLAEADPVDAGLVDSLQRPSANVTGVSILLSTLVGKRLELTKEIMPHANKVCMLGNLDNPNKSLWRAAQEAAQFLGLTLQLLESSNSSQELIAVVQQAVAVKCNAIVLLDTFRSNEGLLIKHATEHKLPLICDSSVWASHGLGCLLGYGPEFDKTMDRLARYVDLILKGAPPAKIPVERPTTFKMAVNLWVAKTLNIEIPPLVLMQVDKVFK